MSLALNARPHGRNPFPLDLGHDASTALGLKHAMRHLVGGVCVITAGTGDDRTGATVTSANSLSVEPETMVACINLASSTWTAIKANRHFCVNLLGAGHAEIADRFSGRGGIKGPARYEGARWLSLETGALALDGALAAIDCELEHVVERHSHAVVFGAVRAVLLGGDAPALVYSHGRYGHFGHGIPTSSATQAGQEGRPHRG
jgi:flavin reductase (DIM6/NTAB) family NADH-FMN oxidoreductase RutF